MNAPLQSDSTSAVIPSNLPSTVHRFGTFIHGKAGQLYNTYRTRGAIANSTLRELSNNDVDDVHTQQRQLRPRRRQPAAEQIMPDISSYGRIRKRRVIVDNDD